MQRKSFLYFIYILYLTLVLEALSFTSVKILKNRIVFRSNYTPPEDRGTDNFHPILGWASNDDRINPGGTMSCFGDSFTYGDEVNSDEAWPSLLNNSVLKTSNYGVGAYGVDQAYLRSSLEINNNSKFFLLSFISENIYRNLNTYRPFYYPNSGLYYTKPRYKIKNQNIVLQANPIRKKEDLKKLQSLSYLKELADLDFYDVDINTPDNSFPYIRVLFNLSFWSQLQVFFTTGSHLTESKNAPSMWKSKKALRIQDYILNQFIKNSTLAKKTPIIMHLPTRREILKFQKKGELPQAIVHTKEFCSKIKSICWFPLLNKKIWDSQPTEILFSPGGHYSPEGNRVIFNFVKLQIEKLREKNPLLKSH